MTKGVGHSAKTGESFVTELSKEDEAFRKLMETEGAKFWEESGKFHDALIETETSNQISRRLEDVLDHLINDKELSDQSKAWLSDRKDRRAKA
tara:strand:+ start:518 stop:796 length:279 start_codon:yes stop_codon:yes gene_type:complete